MSQRQDGAEIEVTINMVSAGAEVYRAWEADAGERGKLNGAANLVARVYEAMEVERRLSE